MKIILIILLCFMGLNADVSNQVTKSGTQQNTKKQSNQISNNKTKSINKTVGKGAEKSNSKTISQTLSKISSINHSITKSINGNWNITLNPIPYVLETLRGLGWNKKSFWLTQDDIGAVDYIIADDDEYGELQNVNKLQAIQSEAQNRKRIGKAQTIKLERYISLLYNTANITAKAIKILQNYPDLQIENFNYKVKEAVFRAYKSTRGKKIIFTKCNYAGDTNSYSCDYGRYTLILTNALPNLLIDGAPYYSHNSMAFLTPSISISFATSTSNAFSKLAQNQQSNTIAGMIRDYTNKLEQRGESETATRIKNLFVEKTLNNSITHNTSAIVDAINSGSPLAVLKIFQ